MLLLEEEEDGANGRCTLHNMGKMEEEEERIWGEKR